MQLNLKISDPNSKLKQFLSSSVLKNLKAIMATLKWKIVSVLKLEKSRKNSCFSNCWTFFLNGLDTDRFEVELGRNHQRNSLILAFIRILNWLTDLQTRLQMAHQGCLFTFMMIN